MGLNVEQKKAIVADMHEILGKSQAIVAADYLRLTVTEMTKLRAQAHQKHLHFRTYYLCLIACFIYFGESLSMVYLNY